MARCLRVVQRKGADARKTKFGDHRYKLIGIAEFLTKEELLRHQQRGEVTRPEVANATGQLQHGKKLVVKGLLITASNERRLQRALTS